MRSSLLRCGPLFIAVLAGACTKYGFFREVGSDPHPPRVEMVGVAYTPVPLPPVEVAPETITESTTTTASAPEIPPPDFKPADGFEVTVNDPATTSLVIRLRFEDAGGDIVAFFIRDRDGNFTGSAGPVAPEVDFNGDGVPDTVETPDFFTGTSGTVDLLDLKYISTMLGTHRLEIWAEDSHGTRSSKISFTIKVLLATR